ncbi:MAG: phage Gp37/Gp68 family protein [Ktedonobacteraceae bacterium]|nr:phage Gp37/Gp68 family protein [Ktedonobacteraceae bacterium]
MAATTIEWTHRCLADGTSVPGYTFNVVWGCAKVSEGCRDCYALTFARRLGLDLWGLDGPRRTFGLSYWQQPLRWNKQAQRSGHRRNVFCSSMADVFEAHPTVEQERTKLWPLMERTPWLNWLLLTKRPEHIMAMVPWGKHFPDNVWMGTSVENQRRADERVPLLLEVPAVVRFLSCEPLLEGLDLTSYLARLSWVIVGGESGARARPMEQQWVRALRSQAQAHGTCFFFKQWGGRTHTAGGRLLDGRTWDEMPPECPGEVI